MKRVLILITCLFMLCGCTNINENTKELNVLNWTSYIPSDVISDFEKEYDIKVNYNTYSSNEELLAKVSSSKSGTYDLIFPSDFMVELMHERGLLEDIDKTKITNYDNINPLFLSQSYDLNNDYSLPFLVATTVIAVNRNEIKDNITSYNDLLNTKYKNNIVVLDDQRITIGMGLLANNYDMSDINDTHLNEAKEYLLNLKDNIKAYDSDSPKTFLITNETSIGVMWNAEAEVAKKENSNIEIIYPSDGYAISIDNYAILKNSKNIDYAYLFIDYLLRDDVSKKIVSEYPYISSNVNANSLTPYEMQVMLNNAKYVKNIGSNISKYDKIWADVK